MCGLSPSTMSWIKDIASVGSAAASVGLAAKSAFSSQPKAARVQAPEAPSISDDSVQQAADKERRRLSMARGAGSTNVTKGQFEDSSLFISPTLGGR